MIYDAAISYAKEEADRAEEVAAALTSDGLAVWTDRGLLPLGEDGEAERLVPAGIKHWETIRDAIDRSATFIFLDSPRWRASAYCHKEHVHALERGMRIVAVGDAGDGRPEAAGRVGAGDLDTLVAAVREGLDLSRAHARVRLCAFAAEAASGGGVAPDDVPVLSAANLAGLGMSLSPSMTACMEQALARQRHRRRRIGTLAGAALTVVALLVVVAVVAWIAARQDEGHAEDAARHVESLALAATSEGTVNTFARLGLARRAISLEENPATIAALRAAIEGFGEGVTIRLDHDEPIALTVANDGDIATVEYSGAISLIPVGGGQPGHEVPAERAGAGPVLDFSPDGSMLAVVRREDGGAEVVEFETGRLTRVAGTKEVAALFFISDERAIAVSQMGEVLEFDPREGRPRARRVQWVLGPVRAAALASTAPDGAFGLATLVDSAVEVTDIGGFAAPWRAPLPHPQTDFSLGWESLRVCGDDLAVLGTAKSDNVAVSFAIPYTVGADGEVVETGSLLHSAGSICLPGGTALAIDPKYGQHQFPAGGPTLPGLVPESGGLVAYAIGSSENGQWAAAAGSDGNLKIVELGSYGRARPVRSLEEVAPTAGGDPLFVADDGALLEAPLAGGTIHAVATEHRGEAVRGAYLDRRLGTVLALGERVLIVRGGRVRETIAVGEPIWVIHQGRPGVSAVVVTAGSNRAIELPLEGGPRTAVEIPGDAYSGATQLSDVIALAGPPRRLAIAGTDGNVRLVAFPGGEELARRRIAPSGPVSLALGDDGRLLTGNSDGVVRILDPRTLATETSRRVFSPGPMLIVTDSSGELAAAFQPGGETVVLALPSLEPTTHVAPIDGLTSVAFDRDLGLVLGADLHLIGGGHEASLNSWPLCHTCGSDPERLQAIAARLVEPPPAGEQPTFIPVRDEAEGTGETGGVIATPAGVGELRLGMSASELQEGDLIGPLQPGCELNKDQQVAELLAPLDGYAVFSDAEERLSSLAVSGGAETSHGIAIGSTGSEMLAAYPDAEFEPPQEHSPFPYGFLHVTRGEEALMTLIFDPETQLVTEIDVPYPNFCD